MKVLIIDKIHPALQEIMEAEGHECLDLSNAPISEVKMAIPFAEILILRSRMNIDREVIDSASKLKLIGRPGAGIEHIDVDYAHNKGVKVITSPEGNKQAVAEHSLTLLLSLLNRLRESNNQVVNGVWDRKSNEGEELSGKTVGIIGFGNTGSAFAQVLGGFGVEIIAYDKYKTGFAFESTMQQVFDQADVVSLHLPLTDETKGLVNSKWIDQFKKPIYLINTSRGQIAKTEDMLEGLRSGSIRGICLDVSEHENSNLQMPEFSELPSSAIELFNHERVIATPHTAGLTVQSYEKLSRILAEKILANI